MNSNQDNIIKKSKLDSLTGLRGIVALWVVLFHLVQYFPIIDFPIIKAGWLGVDFFFVLSGFVLAYNYYHWFSDKVELKSYKKFIWLRIARIYPVHIITLLAMLAIYWAMFFFNRPSEHPESDTK